MFLRHAKNVVVFNALERLSERLWSMAYHLHTFQKMEREWFILENFNNSKTEETTGISGSFYGFHHCKTS
jgi:hypothetical protein